MAEEEVVADSVEASADHHKRKHEDLEEPDVPHPEFQQQVAEPNSDGDGDPEEEEKEESPSDDVPESSDAKRPRLDNDLAPDNEHQAEHAGELLAENGEEMDADDDEQLEDDQVVSHRPLDEEAENPIASENELKTDEQVSTADNTQTNDSQIAVVDSQLENLEKPSEDVGNEQDVNAHNPEQFSPGLDYPESGTETTSRRMEVPNNKVGVLIGKGGDTIRLLQNNSGAKIQITRDAEADPRSSTRPVELIGTLANIHKAENLIKDVIAEADAGGSPSLAARGFTTTVVAEAAEQVEIQVPHDKVGFIIGKGGDTIKSLQTRSGARIQLIPQHSPEDDQLKGRTLRVSGDRQQIELARELIKEVMTKPPRFSQSSNYNQSSHRARTPAGTQQWGNRNTHYDHQFPQGYQQRGHYPSQDQHYPSYGGYNPRSSYGSGWEQRPQQTHHGAPHAATGGYNYYGGQGHGSASNVSAPSGHSTHMGPTHSQANYNYGKPRGPDYGHQSTQYSQKATPLQQSYGQGYPETSQAQNLQQQPLYGGHGTPQPGNYPDSSVHQGYGYTQPQQQFNRPVAPYGVPSQGAPPQPYTAPAVGQGGDMQHYQTPVSSMQPYGQNMPPQQAYPYASSGYSQAPYALAPASASNDGYNQVLQAAAAYPQQGYVQQTHGYPQAAPVPGAYSQYPTAQQQGYGDQVGQAAAYGYQQGQVDPSYAAGQVYNMGASSVAAQGYGQPAPAAAPASAPNQASYDQLGGYGGVPAGTSASASTVPLSPQPQAQTLVQSQAQPQTQAQAQAQPQPQPQPQAQPQPGYAQPQAQY